MEQIAFLKFSILPSISVVCCTVILANLVYRKVNIDSFLLFACLFLMGLSQTIGYILGYLGFLGKSATFYCADAYLVTMYFFFPSLLLFAVHLSIKPRRYRFWLYVPSLILTILHINGLMIEGYRFEQASLMHIDGPAAPLFDYFAIFCCISSILIARQNIKHNESRVLKSKNRLMIISFTPLVFVFISLILLSRTEYAISATVASPLITLYAACAYFYLTREVVIDCSSGFGFFIERLKLAYKLLETDKTRSGIKLLTATLEKQFIEEALIEAEGDIFKAAKQIGMHHTTLRGKLKEYEMAIQPNMPRNYYGQASK